MPIQQFLRPGVPLFKLINKPALDEDCCKCTGIEDPPIDPLLCECLEENDGEIKYQRPIAATIDIDQIHGGYFPVSNCSPTVLCPSLNGTYVVPCGTTLLRSSFSSEICDDALLCNYIWLSITHSFGPYFGSRCNLRVEIGLTAAFSIYIVGAICSADAPGQVNGGFSLSQKFRLGPNNIYTKEGGTFCECIPTDTEIPEDGDLLLVNSPNSGCNVTQVNELSAIVV